MGTEKNSMLSVEVEENDGEEISDVSTKFLPSKKSSVCSSDKVPRHSFGRRSASMIQVVLEAVRQHSDGRLSRPESSNCTPTGSRKDLAAIEKRDKKSPSTKRQLWALGRKSQKLSKSMTEPETTMLEEIAPYCQVSDGPNYVFKMAAKGNTKQISDVVNARPERIISRDVKGASILHHAAAHGKLKVMDFVLADQEGSTLLNSRDETCATPLHWAACNDCAESIHYLISRGADPGLKNSAGESPLHTSVQKKSLKALQALLKHKETVNVNDKMSVSGSTALHLASYIDYADGAKLLLSAGAKPCISCQHGYTPIHCAAFAGSKNAMKILLEWCHANTNYTAEKILSYSDKELSSPLHCAVLGGNLEAIKMCLDYGARLDKQQADLSTPMHLVCAQGASDIVHLMFEIARKQAVETLNMQDKQMHTPLHKVAMYGHATLVTFLLENGANADVLDTEQNSPLLLAAARENWVCVQVLMEAGANLVLKNKDDRNLMHMIVLKGGDIKNLDPSTEEISMTYQTIFSKPEVNQLLNEADSFGCTPLHYACQEGNLASLETLMMLGVSARLKSVGNQSALHFAAMYGRYNACRKLINSPQGPNIINDKDDKGMTPLHFAAQNGHFKVVQLLLNKGAVFHRTTRGETVLHVAAENGYTKTMRTLVSMNKMLVDEVDDEGNTALHTATRASQVNSVLFLLDCNAEIIRNHEGSTFFSEAIHNHNRDIALAVIEHDRWEEAMQGFCKENRVLKVPSLMLIQHLPDVWVVAMNRCVETSDCHPKSKKYWVKYHFKYLQPSVERREELIEDLKGTIHEKNPEMTEREVKHKLENMIGDNLALPALNRMVMYNRVECLRHPVSVAYLQMKWKAYGRWVHGINLFVYMLGLFPLTYLATTMDSRNHQHSMTNVTMANPTPTNYTSFQFAMMILLTFLSCCQIVKEGVQMVQQRIKYFTDMTNLIEWMLYLSSLLYVTPFFAEFPTHWQFEFGAVAVLLAWFNFLLFLQRFDIAGIYVVMFIEILRTLLKVLAVFSFLILAFSLSFFVLMGNEADKSFSNPLLAMMRIVTMTLGEIGYVEMFLEPYVDSDPSTLHFSLAAMLLLALFILFMPILLMNLLIGLAVGDIAEVQSNAELQRLAMQVQLHTDIETRLSARILSVIDKYEYVVYPNKQFSMVTKLWGYVSSSQEVSNSNSPSAFSTTDRNINGLSIELQKQKQRIKEMQLLLHKQHELTRLIVQKMEIRSEADNHDEGSQPKPQREVNRNRSRLVSTVGTKLLATRAVKSMK